MIRPATPADVPTILSLLRELAAYEKLSHALADEPPFFAPPHMEYKA